MSIPTTLLSDKPTHVWVFDINRRVYPVKAPGEISRSPIYREHWAKREIIGETTRSWLIGSTRWPVKVPKRGADHRRFLFNEKDVDDDVWANDHRYRIERLIQTLSPEKLRQVAELIGYEAAT
jgi:hypothetical protein